MKWKVFFLCVLFAVTLSGIANAQGIGESQTDQSVYYREQMELSGADALPEELPNDTRLLLEGMGVEGADWESVQALSPGQIFMQIVQMVQGEWKGPLSAGLQVIAVMLLCALMEGMKLSFGESPLGGVIGAVSTLCVCGIIITPIVSCIHAAATVIQGAAGFMLCYIPVLAGIMIAGGQTVSGASYQLLMVGAGEVLSQLASGFLVPLLSIFLGLSIVSSLAPRLNLGGICEMFSKVTKWVLGLAMTVFTGLLTVQSLVGTAADNAGTRTAKFVLSSFVPVVGGALSEALNTVQGCVKLLKSGVGAFGILAAGFIFLPVLLQCLLWMASTSVCAYLGDMFGLGQLSSLLRAAGKVVGVMLAILLCCMMVLTVSTVLVLMIGGGTG
jgi:stage III sporulation protein AE